jgi:hypothetical protein
MRKVLTALLLLLAGACATTPKAQYVRGNRLVSKALPPIEIEVAPEFRYVGAVPFRIRDVAAGDRHVFVEADGMRVKRLLVFQFESFLPNVDDYYRYDFTNARDIGGYPWRHSVYWYSQRALSQENPGGEATVMHEWLAKNGYLVDDELLMSRFLTLGHENRKSELILFYLENAKDNGVTLAELDANESLRSKFEEGLVARSLAAFKITRPAA